MGKVKFDTTLQERELIKQIAGRAVERAREHGVALDTIDVQMDVTAVHANGCPLKLSAFLKADDTNFAHDIVGIHRHLDRNTGKLRHNFLPRFAAL